MKDRSLSEWLATVVASLPGHGPLVLREFNVRLHRRFDSDSDFVGPGGSLG